MATFFLTVAHWEKGSTMKQLIRYNLEEGGSVVVEVAVPEVRGMKPAAI